MSDNKKLLMFVGGLLVLTFAVLYFAAEKTQWIGNLPGDIKHKGTDVSFYIPITTMIILTIAINASIKVFRHLTS